MNILKTISLNSILYAILLFLSVWGTLQINKPNIPLSNLMYYGSLFALFYIKKGAISKSICDLKPIFYILIIGIVLLIAKGISNENYMDSICTFFKFFWVCILLEKAKPKELTLSKIITIIFLILNCLIMIYERSIMTVLFWNSEDYGTWRDKITELTQFRASGLTGHPVLGAFLVTMELAFIQFSRLKNKWKYGFTVLLFISLLCLNSRSNIIISAAMSIYLFKDALLNKKNRFLKILLLAATFYFFSNLIVNTDWGGRLINNELGESDSSTMARLDIFGFVRYLNWNQLLWGGFGLEEYIMKVMGMAGIENGYIVLVLKYGLIGGVPLIVALIYYQWKVLFIYPKIERLIIFFVFVVMANTNPHIGHAIPWIYWGIYYYLFRPDPIPISINK